jgi:hypothetical protein
LGDRYQFVSKVGIEPVEVAPLEGAALRLEVIGIVIHLKDDPKAFLRQRGLGLSGGIAELTKVAGPNLSVHLFTR